MITGLESWTGYNDYLASQGYTTGGTDTGFDDVYLPSYIADGATGGPEYRTTIVETGNGQEQRVAQWQRPRHRWTISTPPDDREAHEKMLSFFHGRRGKLRGFRFRDINDSEAENQPLVPIAVSTLQMYRLYWSGGQGVSRLIRKPVAGSVLVFLNGAVVNPANWTLNASTGAVTIVGGFLPGVYTWSGKFDVPVRFDTDQMDGTSTDSHIREWQQIAIVEVL
jgi:uncharacterized protein (TIGR02217 family)